MPWPSMPACAGGLWNRPVSLLRPAAPVCPVPRRSPHRAAPEGPPWASRLPGHCGGRPGGLLDLWGRHCLDGCRCWLRDRGGGHLPGVWRDGRLLPPLRPPDHADRQAAERGGPLAARQRGRAVRLHHHGLLQLQQALPAQLFRRHAHVLGPGERGASPSLEGPASLPLADGRCRLALAVTCRTW